MANELSGNEYTHMNTGDRGDQFSTRTAEDWAGFLMASLQPGMSVLDCGCGSGSITLGLAKAVAPGDVVGIDLGEAALEHARESSQQEGIANVRFEQASVYQIPFEDATFDAVLANMVLSHLDRPGDAISEMYRVLKPGGVVGVTDVDIDGGFLIAPSDDPIMELYDLWFRVMEHNGGDPRIGKHLRGLLHEAGFNNVRGLARSQTRGTREEIEAQGTLTFEAMSEAAAKLGWTDAGAKDRVADRWKAFAARPGAFLSYNFCQAIGWKD